MTNPPKQKGTRFETDVVRYLNSRGIPCERRALNGANDKGDIAGIPGWVLELKNHRSIALASWASEAERERLQASEFYWAVVHKRYRRGTPEAYVTIPLSTFADVIGAPKLPWDQDHYVPSGAARWSPPEPTVTDEPTLTPDEDESHKGNDDDS